MGMFNVDDPRSIKKMRELIYTDLNKQTDRDINLMA